MLAPFGQTPIDTVARVSCSLWPSTPPKERCRSIRPRPSAAGDSASTNRAGCVAVCELPHRDHVRVPASAGSSVAPPPAAWQWALLEDQPERARAFADSVLHPKPGGADGPEWKRE